LLRPQPEEPMSASRIERDSLGEVAVPADRYWGAQTQRSLRHFAISCERMPEELIDALALVKQVAAEVNVALGLLAPELGGAIATAASEIRAGRHRHEFPLSVWQTGSGTQTHMNLNEVIANRASELLGGQRGAARLVHPNDHVNLCQSSNDVFPSAMQIAAAAGLRDRLLPALETLQDSLATKARSFDGIVKIGRTHLQDATPLTLGQEFSGYVRQVEQGRQHAEQALPHLCELALGGTAVGTGLNAHPDFGRLATGRIATATGLPFVVASNRFEVMAAADACVHAHGALKTVAGSLMKIANDIRWLASGPRSGIGELRLPENEPGSSIMPGKVNPTQAEALTMICCQVFGNDVAINFGGASGHFELNAFRPMIAHNLLQSLRLLTDGSRRFAEYCVDGIEAREQHIRELLERSLMLVTALVPHIGYDRAAEIARHAHARDLTLREAARSLGYVTAAQFDEWVRPEAMTGGSGSGGRAG
jgi:fumarate hydratase class II